ncbi:MAG: 4Fe-4S dicluster domain-containing protein [Pseudomonadota bacterium]
MEPIPVTTMDNTKVILKTRVIEWLSQLLKENEVIAPTIGEIDDVVYCVVSSPEQVIWNFGNSLQPPKQFVLPQTDPIVRIEKQESGYNTQPIYDVRQRVIFNIRSCDAAGIAFLTKVHAADLPDDSYLKRARSTTLINLACTNPGADCFCTCTNSGPFLKENYDLQLTDLGESYFAEAGSENGRLVLDEANGLFRSPTDEELSKRYELELAAKNSFGKETCHFASAMRRISTRRVEQKLWEDMSEWCIECGACNMICPTCYCFSVKDRKQDNGWLRCRIGDSCQFPAFTLEASGHNPREKRADRMKRRFFHKVSAQYFYRDKMVGCVGCGRCVKVCFGATDMPSVVGAIRKGEWNG